LEPANHQGNRFNEQPIKYKIYSIVSSLEKTDIKISRKKDKEGETRNYTFPLEKFHFRGKSRTSESGLCEAISSA